MPEMFNLVPSYPDNADTVYTSDGSTTDYTISFDYIGRTTWDGSNSSQILVYTGDTWDSITVTTAWTMPSASTVRFTSAPANGKLILIRRDSQLLSKRAVYQDGAKLTAANLQLAYDHCRFLVQEVTDKLNDLSAAVNPNNGDSTVGFLGNHFQATATGSSQNISLTGERGQTVYSILVTDNGAYVDTNTYTVSDVAGVSTVNGTWTSGHTIRIRVLAGGITSSSSPSANSVGTTQIQDAAVTLVKINFNSSGSDGQFLGRRSGAYTPTNVIASDMADLDSHVRANNSLDQLQPPGADIDWGGSKITGLGAPTSSGDATTKTYVDTLVSTSVAGISDGGRILTGDMTAGTSFVTITLGSPGWSPDALWIMPDFGLSSGVRCTGPSGTLAAPVAVPTQVPLVHAYSFGTTIQDYVFAYAADLPILRVQRITTGFKFKLIPQVGLTPIGTQLFHYIAIRNSTVS